MRRQERKRKSQSMHVDTLRSAERALNMGERLTPGTIADLIERFPDHPLPSKLRAYLCGLLRGQSRLPRGAGRKNDGIIWEFTIAKAQRMYGNALTKCRAEDKRERERARAEGRRLPRAEVTASERAAKVVIERMGDELSIKHPKTLRTVLSKPLRTEVSAADEIPPGDNDPPDHISSNRTRMVPIREQKLPPRAQ